MFDIPTFWPDELEKATKEELIYILVEYQKINIHLQTYIEGLELKVDELKNTVEFLWKDQL